MPTAEVLICRNVPTPYSYSLPSDTKYIIGQHVEVPFGRSLATGIITAIHNDKDETRLKPVGESLSKKPIVSTELLALINWMAEHYQISPHKAYQSVIGKMKLRKLADSDEDKITTSEPNYSLTEEQNAAIKTMMSKSNQAFLLHGVTASGKTEVYMRLAKQVLDKGQGVLILLPEIALTPQIRESFTTRFGGIVAVIHSGLTPKEREIAWNKIYENRCRIVIGPRSAVFTPLKDIGLIVLDEEHEPSYKQDTHPRYWTHQIAEFRRDWHQCMLVYGTATPCLEVFARSQFSTPTIQLVTLNHRISKRPLPAIQVVDMKQNWMDHRHPFLSQVLIDEISKNLEKKEKTMILLNRRGYSTTIICRSCGELHTCPGCNLGFTFHRDQQFRCHRCDITSPLTHTCSSCGKTALNFAGMGTQKIEAELFKLFPQTNILRLDKDATKSSKAVEAVLSDFRNDGDILIGTQMIAKGHHFDTVTLVGVLGIDTILGIPDFRSGERAFQLISQVAGRAGRGEKPGRVLVQTLHPSHYAIQHASTHSYDKFFAQEMIFRDQMFYPPYSVLTRIILSSTRLSELQTYAKTIGPFIHQAAKEISNKVQVLGPKPAPIEMIRDHHRWHILVKCSHDDKSAFKKVLRKHPAPPQSVRLIMDFDPRSVL